jgi:polar amino acid transport system substrate-binding protein
MKMMRRILLSLVASAGLLAAIPPALAQQDNLIETVKQRGRLLVAFGTFVPWAMRDRQGQWIGFEIEVASRLAKDLGVQIDLLPTAWDAIIPSLIAGKFDVIIGGMTITPARQAQIDFSDPYSTSGQNVAASKQIAAGLKWPQDFNSPKVTFTCRRGVAGCKTIQDRFPKATLRQFDDDAIAFQEVINAKAHAVISSEPKPTFFTLKNPDRLFKPSSENLVNTFEGFGVRKGNPAALKVFNNWIAQNKDWLKSRHDYWFKSQEWQKLVP